MRSRAGFPVTVRAPVVRRDGWTAKRRRRLLVCGARLWRRCCPACWSRCPYAAQVGLGRAGRAGRGAARHRGGGWGLVRWPL